MTAPLTAGAVECFRSLSLIAAPLRGVARNGGAAGGDSAGAGARSHAADRSGGEDRPAAQRPPLFHPRRTRGPQSACRCGWPSTPARSRRNPISAGSRTSSSTWRSTAPRTSSRASWCRSSNRSARASARTSTRRRRSTKPSTCSTSRPIARAIVDGACSCCTTSPRASRCCRPEIEKERGVVLEEWRGRLGAGSRLTDKQLPVIFQGSRYAERLPIGLPEILKSAPRERLLAFYQKWYRPDQMAVVVVGDIPVAEAEKLVQQHFGGIPAAKGARGHRRHQRAGAQGDADQHGDRSRSAGLDGVDRVQGQGRAGRNRARLSQVAGREPGVADAEPAPARNRAASERAVPRRAGRHQRHRPHARAVRDRSRRARRARSPKVSAR